VTATVALETLVARPEENVFAEPGDVLTLVRRPQTFSVFGATGKNAAITFNSDKLSLGEALAQAGGLNDDSADPGGVFLFRYEPVETVRALGQPIATNAPQGVSPIAYRLDLSDAKSYLLAKRFPVRDKDVIFVADSESRDASKIATALSNIVGPVETILITCANSAC
ncbi:MAG TPA: polysaccharide export protein, partial [Stellaceae bacterium]